MSDFLMFVGVLAAAFVLFVWLIVAVIVGMTLWDWLVLKRQRRREADAIARKDELERLWLAS